MPSKYKLKQKIQLILGGHFSMTRKAVFGAYTVSLYI